MLGTTLSVNMNTANLFHFFVLGIDNMQSIMQWSVLVLGKHSSVAEKIFMELQQTVAMDTSVTTESRQHLPYTGVYIIIYL